MKFNKKSLFAITSLLVIILLFSSCAPAIDVETCTNREPYGFWRGLWHGIIAPISFVISLFKEDVAMYAINNNGGWYDFGFVLGAGIIFGGGCKGSCKSRK